MAKGCSAEVKISDYRWRPCGQDIKADGLCARHLAGQRRSAAAAAKYDAKRQASDAAKAEGIALLAELGIAGKPFYENVLSRIGEYQRAVVINIDELRRWAATKETQ